MMLSQKDTCAVPSFGPSAESGLMGREDPCVIYGITGSIPGIPQKATHRVNAMISGLPCNSLLRPHLSLLSWIPHDQFQSQLVKRYDQPREHQTRPPHRHRRRYGDNP